MKKSDLLKMILELRQRVDRLEKDMATHHHMTPVGHSTVIIPSVWINDPCPAGGQHQYPSSWNATVPPACIKCNTVREAYTITCNGVSGSEV